MVATRGALQFVTIATVTVLALLFELHLLRGHLSPERNPPRARDEEVPVEGEGVSEQALTATSGGPPGRTGSSPRSYNPPSSVSSKSSTSNAAATGRPSRITSEVSTWKRQTFCHDFLLDTYHDHLPMCGGEVAKTNQVKCSGTVYSSHIALCSYENVVMRPQQMKYVIPNDVTWKKPADKTIHLLQSTELSCPSSSMSRLLKKTDRDDFEIKLTQHLLESKKLSQSVCDVWINKTTVFHVSNALHIYFRFLDLYSVHKVLFDSGLAGEDHLVLRIGNLGSNYRFPLFDKALFPGALTLHDLHDNETVCFKKVVFAPRSYQSIPFRCKMESTLRKRCLECNGRGLTGSPLYTFRTRVLRACNITEQRGKTSRLVVVSRKPYKRWSSDDPKSFQRILHNEDDMESEIRKAFPNITVDVVYMEELDICEQVRYAVEADVMLGVHGAGLVHFWWLRDEATAFELEPSFQAGNPSFKMLTKLTGRTYVSERAKGISKSLTVNVDHVLKRLKQYL